ncbi:MULTISPECIES: phage tail protein [unclassified Gilvimarinus]|uniref:phage tail protein n=1 Tax=unclassified Gilvimarinus TaxID=2642066 RepID=UPI0026E1AEC7|nr:MULTISPECIES: tail fiber protein [unclassified Gilvimarinus]MDO6570355.1 tail fiber protein [Gilvimarinus sp. 2_MG-2023]MDO6747591.1 tail fiber protein [Gilvimarinus sp. 1_MG-2023]
MEPFLGEIRTVGFNFAPRGWELCAGQLIPISNNSALFSLLGTTYGGDGRTSFALPDLRSRSIVGFGHGPGLSNTSWGEKGGAEQRNISVANLPPHSSSVNLEVAIPATTNSENLSSEPDKTKHLGPAQDGGRAAELYSEEAVDTTLAPFPVTGSTSSIGGGYPLETRDPYLGIYYVIAMQGIFPSRN